MLFIHPLPWPHGTVKSPLTVHFRIRSEAVDHPGTFCLLFFTYRVFRHTTRLTYFFHILRIQTYYSFSILLFVYYEFGHTILAYFFARYEFGHTTLLTYCFSHTMNSDILLFWHCFSHTMNSDILLFWYAVFRILWIRKYYFDILFFAYYEFGHTTLLICCFSHTMNSEILFWHTVFRILYSREVFDFGRSESLNAWQLYPKIQARNALLIHKHFLFIGKCIGIWYSSVFLFVLIMKVLCSTLY